MVKIPGKTTTGMLNSKTEEGSCLAKKDLEPKGKGHQKKATKEEKTTSIRPAPKTASFKSKSCGVTSMP